jgi:hypothetical protein
MVSMSNSGPTVDADTLTAIAAARRDHQRLRFDYHNHEPGRVPAPPVRGLRMVHRCGPPSVATLDALTTNETTVRIEELVGFDIRLVGACRKVDVVTP